MADREAIDNIPIDLTRPRAPLWHSPCMPRMPHQIPWVLIQYYSIAMSDIYYDDAKDAWCHGPSGACSENGGVKPALPTYSTIADVLEKKNGSGIRLVGWTVARTALIAPFMMAVGVPAKKAFAGAAIASAAISIFTLIRIYNAEYEVSREYLSQRKWLRRRSGATAVAGPIRRPSPRRISGTFHVPTRRLGR